MFSSRPPQLTEERQALGRVLVAVGRVHLVAGVRFLGHVHGNVGALDQRVDVVSVVGEERDPDRGLNIQRKALQHERPGQRRRDLAGHAHRGVRARRSGQKHRKLVAAEASDRVDVAKQAAQARSDGLQNQIAVAMTKRVVDLLEPVQVHDQEREARILATRLQDRLLHTVAEKGSVGKPGQRIVKSLVLVLLDLDAQLLGSACHESELGQIENGQRDRDKHPGAKDQADDNDQCRTEDPELSCKCETPHI